MKRVSEEIFLEQIKDGYKYWFRREFQDLRQDNNVILIYERADFPPWSNVRHCFGNRTCILVDRKTDKVFVIETGYYAQFQVLLYAHANDFDLLSNRTITESSNFISDGQGYCFDAINKEVPVWLAGESLREDVHDRRILIGQKLIGFISSKFDNFPC